VRQYATPGQRADGNPKRPMNAFILFSNEKRSELADLNPHLSNAAVSVLLGQRWREMHSGEKSGYVTAARRIKEDFHAANPDAKTRCVSRKGKRKFDSAGGPSGSRIARNVAPPSLHALALVGSRLNQAREQSYAGKHVRPRPAEASSSPFDDDRRTSTFDEAAMEDDDDEYDNDDDDDECTSYAPTRSEAPSAAGDFHRPLTALEQLCTVAENEHTAAAKMLSTLASC